MFGGREKEHYCTLEECCVSVTGGSTPSMKREDYYGGEVPFIKSGDMKNNYVSSGALWLTQKALDETTARYVPAGTVIVVTRSGILKHDLPVAITTNPVVINQDLKAFEPKPEFLPQYLAWAIRSKEDALLSKTRAMTVDNIESRELYEIPVMIAPIEEQEQFAAFVQQSDKSKFVVQTLRSKIPVASHDVLVNLWYNKARFEKTEEKTMPATFSEQHVEDMVIKAIENNGWEYIPAAELPRAESDVLE